MAGDIDEKIKRLRQLGASAGEPTAQSSSSPAPKGKRKKSPAIPFKKDPAKRRRTIIGITVVALIILLIGAFVYHNYQVKQEKELQQAKYQKLLEVKKYFDNSPLANSTVKKELILKIERAKTIQEVNSINVKAVYEQAYQQYLKEQQEKERQKELQELQQAKDQKLSQLKTYFNQFLSMPLPDNLTKYANAQYQSLVNEINSAKSVQEVQQINIMPTIIGLWKRYKIYQLNQIPGDYVLITLGNQTELYTKQQAMIKIEMTNDITQLEEMQISKVTFVSLALAIPRTSIVGGYVQPGDKIAIYGVDPTTGKYQKIVSEGFVQVVLVPTSAAAVNAYENYALTLTTTEQESNNLAQSGTNSTQYTLYDTTQTVGSQTSQTSSESNSSQYSNSQSQSYTYSTNLAELLKALALGQVQDPQKLEQALQHYGLKLMQYENQSNLEVIPSNALYLVVIKVPEGTVADLLNHQNIVVVRIDSQGGESG